MITKQSSALFSKEYPFSPGENEMSKFWTRIDSAMRKLMYAKFLPGQEYAPEKRSQQLAENRGITH